MTWVILPCEFAYRWASACWQNVKNKQINKYFFTDCLDIKVICVKFDVAINQFWWILWRLIQLLQSSAKWRSRWKCSSQSHALCMTENSIDCCSGKLQPHRSSLLENSTLRPLCLFNISHFSDHYHPINWFVKWSMGTLRWGKPMWQALASTSCF